MILCEYYNSLLSDTKTKEENAIDKLDKIFKEIVGNRKEIKTILEEQKKLENELKELKSEKLEEKLMLEQELEENKIELQRKLEYKKLILKQGLENVKAELEKEKSEVEQKVKESKIELENNEELKKLEEKILRLEQKLKVIKNAEVVLEGEYNYKYYLWIYINKIGKSLFDVFKKIFIDDDLRIVIRAYNENEETREITYVPIWDNSNELNIDKNSREYKYQKIDELKKTDNKKYITALAYEEKEIKYYSLNKEAIDFSVKSWEDFAVIVPKVNHWSIPDESSHDGEYPLISIVFSVKLSQVAINTKTYAEKKILYKELCNKLYLLQYIELRKGIQDVFHKFNSIFDFQHLDKKDKIKMLEYCREEYKREVEEEKNNK
jgi:hypothetical protein